MLLRKIMLIFCFSIWPLMSIGLISGCTSTTSQESTGQYIDNSAITLKVKSALLADDSIKSLGISVKSYKGVVELSGFVDTAAQKTTATDIARNVMGVKAVVDALVIKSH